MVEEINEAMRVGIILIHRLYMKTPKSLALCRLVERVLMIWPAPLPKPFVKEVGEVVKPLEYKGVRGCH